MFAQVTADSSVRVGEVSLLSEAERAAIDARNETSHEVKQGLLLDAFDAQVASNPDAVALRFEGESLTYAELDARVNQLARYLQSQGVGAESMVALLMRRSFDLVIGMYAVVRAGGAYVPFVSGSSRLSAFEYVLDVARPVLVLESLPDVSGYSTERVPSVGASG